MPAPKKMKWDEEFKTMSTSSRVQSLTNTSAKSEIYGKFEGENKDQYFKRVYENSSVNDITLEYLYFLRNLPPLPNTQLALTVNKVSSELKIQNLSPIQMEHISPDPSHVTRRFDRFPILDALSCKLGISLRNILAPPTAICILCQKPLVANNKPVQVPLFDNSGPDVGTKYIFDCNNCKAAWKLNPIKQTRSLKQHVHYHPDRLGNPVDGYQSYPSIHDIKVVRGSTESYYKNRFVDGYSAELNHCWTSFEGKAESYNETFRDTDKVKYFKDFLETNPEVGGHFRKHFSEDENEDFFDENNEDVGFLEKQKTTESSRMWELKRKNLSQAYFNRQIQLELKERKIESKGFGPKMASSNTQEKKTYKQTVNEFMKEVDELRKEEIYPHNEEDCSSECKKRGCGFVVSVDGLWKLSYKICMFDMIHKYPGQNIQEYLPNVCPEEPQYGNAFCSLHSVQVQRLGYPCELRPFLEKCGADPNSYTKEGKAKVKEVLTKLAKDTPVDLSAPSAEDAQGIGCFTSFIFILEAILKPAFFIGWLYSHIVYMRIIFYLHIVYMRIIV